ncbi:zinc finger protein Xfin-like, partial [Penaeus indicus]|uniref:zinc finger protein Xfin-like n=1 Tax=Penaeus indicus TaxID=29960 RepID=UPI00300C75B5
MENVVGNKKQKRGVDKETEEGEEKKKCDECRSLNNGRCLKCPVESVSVGRRDDHMNYATLESKDIEKRYACEECSFTFKRWSLLQAHKRKHNDGPPFSCCDCGREFESKDEWVDHREAGCSSANIHSFPCTNHDVLLNGKRQGSRRGKSFKCGHCAKSFKTLGSKNDHERNVHNPVRCYSCSECGKSFYKKYNLSIHKETHSDDRSHVCKMCGKKFKTTQGVRMHMESHSNERPFMCEICGKVFKTRAVLESHTAIHTGETKYSCSVCGKAYRYRASLFIHMRTHSGYRPYSCTECDASFMVKSHLTEHMRSHTGEHPFVCKFCSASFTRAISLKKHLKSHVKAGFNVNIDAAMYHAKVQAFVKPRKPYASLTEPNASPTIPKLTHIIQDNVLLNARERIELFVDQPSNEKELTVIKVSCLDETGLCAFDIVQTSSDYDPLCKSGDSDLIDQQTSHTRKEKTLYMKKIQVISSSVESRMGKEVRTITSPTASNAQNTVSGEGIVDSALPSYLTQEGSVQSRKLEDETDWLDSQDVIVDAVLELSVNNSDKESNYHYNLTETEHEKVIVTEVIACENSKISTQIGQSSNYERKVDAAVNGTVISKSGPIDESFESLEHQEVLLQKCSYCDKVYMCKVFAEGDEVCQDCKHLKVIENSKSTAHLQSCDIPDNRRLFRNKLVSRDSDPYHCHICRASFTFRSDLRKH